jgi:MFS family permease
MLTCDALRALVQTITAASIISGRAEVWMIAALSACYGICSAAFVPALIGLIPQTVPTGHAQQANALLGLARSSASVLGPALAGVLIATAGPGEVILRQPLIQARRPQNACPRSHRKKLRDTPASS